MIIDSLANASKYVPLHPLFEKAFQYIASVNWEEHEVGKFDVPTSEGLKAIVSNKNGVTVEESIAKFECHNVHIDIQVCIKGKETIGWKPRETCLAPKGDYNNEKDVLFFGDAPDMFFQLTDGQFVIFFPEDVHAPMIGTDEIKKLVIKVKI